MLRILAILGVLAIVTVVPATPAAAHGGKIKLEVAGDGATGVTVRALYQNDSHPVEDRVLRLTLTATGEGGKAVGPLDVNPAGEGRSFYNSPGVLTPGRWAVVVTSTDTNVLRAESTVDAKAPQTAATQTRPPATQKPVTDAPAPKTSDVADSDEGNGSAPWWTIGFVVALGLAALVVITTRRRGRAADEPRPSRSRRP